MFSLNPQKMSKGPKIDLSRDWEQTLLTLLLLSTPLFVNLWVEQQFEASKIWLARSLIWGLVAVCIGGRLSGLENHPVKHLPLLLTRLVAALFLVICLSTWVSEYTYVSLWGSLERGFGGITQLSLIAFFFCVAVQFEPKQIERALRIAIFTAVPICLLGGAQAAGWQPVTVLTDGRSQLVTTLGRANFTGSYLALLIPLTLAAIESSQKVWENAGFKILFLLQVALILLTQARAAWISAYVAVAVYVWIRIAGQVTPLLRRLIFIFLASAPAAGLAYWFRQGVSAGGSIAARWTIWKASLQLVWPRIWLGYGADTLEIYFPSVYPPELVYYQGRGVTTDRAHNWILDWSLNYGIVATALFIAIVGIIIWRNKPIKSEHDKWVAATIGLVCGHLAGNLVLFDVIATAVLFWLALAFLASNISVSGPHSSFRVFHENKNSKLAFQVGLFATVIGGIGWFNIRPMVADSYSWQGTQALVAGNLTSAFDYYNRAAHFQPFRPAYATAAGLTATQAGNVEQGETLIQTAIDLRPLDPVLWTHLARVYGEAGIAAQSSDIIEQAYYAYEQAITLGPTIGLTYQQAADFAFKAGHIPLARLYAQQAVNLDATDGVAFLILGWSQLQLNELAQAEVAFDQAVKWLPQSADAYLGQATVYFRQGDIEAAQTALDRALNIDPNYTPALTLQLQLPK